MVCQSKWPRTACIWNLDSGEHWVTSCQSEYLHVFLCRIYKRQNKPKKALSQCQKSLQLLMDCSNPERTCSVYRDMATIKQDQGHRASFQDKQIQVNTTCTLYTILLHNIYKHNGFLRYWCHLPVFLQLLLGSMQFLIFSCACFR